MSDFNSPAEVSKAMVRASQTKAALPTDRLIVLGILAGVFIGFGGQIATIVMSEKDAYVGLGVTKILGGSVFLVGLVLVVIAGGELFTGNSLVIVGALAKKITVLQVIRNWVVVYASNFIGALLLVYLMYHTGLWKSGVGVAAVTTANAKVSLSVGEALSRAILCNWLVSLAVWVAAAAKDIGGKVLAMYLPIMVFVASGFEHSVANMYFVPMGILLKGQEIVQNALPPNTDLTNLTWGKFITANLIPVTIGNIIGGALFVGAAYWFVYLRGTQPDRTQGQSDVSNPA